MSVTIDDEANTPVSHTLVPHTLVPHTLDAYLKATQPMPGMSNVSHENLSTLIQRKLDLRDKVKLDRAKKIEAAETAFRRYAIYLMKGIVDAAAVHKSRIALTATISKDAGGAYGVTVTKAFGSKETRKTARIVMADPETPYLVRLEHEKAHGFFYDLASMTPHGSAVGFTRPYLGLLEDLASWLVDGVT